MVAEGTGASCDVDVGASRVGGAAVELDAAVGAIVGAGGTVGLAAIGMVRAFGGCATRVL